MHKKEIWQRTKEARINAGFKDAREILPALENAGFKVSADAYYKYETRTPLKHHLISPFCEITGVREHWLLTGRGQMIKGKAGDLNELMESVKDKYESDPFISPLLQSLEAAVKERDSK